MSGVWPAEGRLTGRSAASGRLVGGDGGKMELRCLGFDGGRSGGGLLAVLTEDGLGCRGRRRRWKCGWWRAVACAGWERRG